MVLALLLSEGAARAQDAGLTAGQGDVPLAAASVRHGLLDLDDGITVQVDGGVWLSDDTAAARARDIVRLAAENRELKAAPAPQVPTPAAVVIGFVAGAVIGGAGAAYGVFRVCAATAVCR